MSCYMAEKIYKQMLTLNHTENAQLLIKVMKCNENVTQRLPKHEKLSKR